MSASKHDGGHTPIAPAVVNMSSLHCEEVESYPQQSGIRYTVSCSTILNRHPQMTSIQGVHASLHPKEVAEIHRKMLTSNMAFAGLSPWNSLANAIFLRHQGC
ncbi:hypothetical protein CBW46_008430 [Paenibacillus xerothermodurans]|uniref:Uncharacterized protein n=1 Tax=Paenibacillus xerothermodurans TaxID=1977292 RepID=A0A2W1NUE8_PAEXE|nr:hypothetical protein CBW46_008430 [Paenibacillus xerothermodurans]